MNKKAEKKVTPQISDAELDAMAKKAGEEIKSKQKKVKIKIPIDKLNPKDTKVPVCINGYIWEIKRGETVEVPENVANILLEAGYI